MRKKQLWQQYKNLQIRKKLLISNIGIISIMVLFLGVMGFTISRNLLVTRSVASSEKLMEQLSYNFNHAVKALEDLVLMQTYQNNFSKLLREDTEGYTNKQMYDRKKEVETYSYNLINFHKSIKTVIIADNFENIYYVSEEGQSMEGEVMKDCVDFDGAYELWGTTYWRHYDENQIFASRLVFDYQTMKPIGVIAIGVDTAYFRELYKNIVEDDSSSIVVLNQNHEILMESDEESRRMAEAIMEKYLPVKETGKEIYYNNRKFIYTTWMTDGKGIQVMNLISEREITNAIFRLLKPLLLSVLVGVLLSAALAFGISGQISSNIRLLLAHIRKVSKGDFSKQMEPDSYDEIGMLAVEFNNMSRQIQQLLETVTNEKIQKKNSELKALQFEYDSLQAKINPHFLYNTLESINSMAKLRGEQKIVDSIYLLGNYLREAISSKKVFVTLEEEIMNIKNYIQIQQLSYEDKIQVWFSLDESLMEAMVPRLILQPLVENAIVHGIEPKIGQGNIRISAKCDKRDMLITVQDDGVGIPKKRLAFIMDDKEDPQRKYTKVGLMTVHKRIWILYGEAYGITIESTQTDGTCIQVRLPIKFEDEVGTDDV